MTNATNARQSKRELHGTFLTTSFTPQALHKREYDSKVNERQLQTKEGKVDTCKALDVSLVVTKRSGTEFEKQDTRSRSGNDVDVTDIKPLYYEEPMAETIEQTTSLIAQKAEFKAQLQEKGFAIAELKNKLRKLTGNSMNTKFAKPSILGKLILYPLRNQSVVRQLTAFKFKQPKFSKPQFASQVDVNNDFSKSVTTHYFPRERKSAFAKPHHVIASSESRNSQRKCQDFFSNNMVHNHYLEEAKKKTHKIGRNSRPRVMPYARSQCTTNGRKPKPMINNQKYRNWPASKNSCVTTNTVPIAKHSRNSRKISDSKHFVCSTCPKCVFNANHDSCVTKLQNKVNSCAKVPSHKTINRIKPIEKISILKKPERQIPTQHRFSIKKTSSMHEKTMTPRSYLRWKTTVRIFKTVGLRLVPTRKIFTSSTKKVNIEPLDGSNEVISNPHECIKTLDVSAGFLNLSVGLSPQRQKALDYDNSGPAPQLQMTSYHNRSELKTNNHSNEPSSSKLVPNFSLSADTNGSSLQELDFLFSPLFEEYFIAGNQSMSKSFALSNNSTQQDTKPTTNIQPTIEPITPPTNVNAEENNIDQAKDARFKPYEFINPFCTPVQEVDESSSRNEICIYSINVTNPTTDGQKNTL
ncbi:hypothetical protein Tco_0939129 [Tanacetum coccineum]|uniref:Uncharacterized protein n=1 Tax=Tanacetum coccineum TaxID=301880 RepID=A0ABQ5DR24_9ASTR